MQRGIRTFCVIAISNSNLGKIVVNYGAFRNVERCGYRATAQGIPDKDNNLNMSATWTHLRKRQKTISGR